MVSILRFQSKNICAKSAHSRTDIVRWHPSQSWFALSRRSYTKDRLFFLLSYCFIWVFIPKIKSNYYRDAQFVGTLLEAPYLKLALQIKQANKRAILE